LDAHDSPSLAGALDALWTRFLPEMTGRVQLLEETARAATANQLTSIQREEAHAAAHKLAGVLGTFGLTRGTVLARELELMYEQNNGRDRAQAEQLTAIASELRTIVSTRK
jgi:HPt (histidine-containing phosphotransfer) domain-containing protein